MSPFYMVDLNQLRRDTKMFTRRWDEFDQMLWNMAKKFRSVRNNERPLVSRNKREGWYFRKVRKGNLDKKQPFKLEARHERVISKEWALRYRKQTGAQVMHVKNELS